MPSPAAIETAGRPSRRRFIAIAGAFAGAALLPAAGHAGGAATLHDWRGVALGAQASIRLLHPDPAEARRLIARVVAEIERLEAIFSLYRPDSALVRLNRDGRLPDPPLELVEVLGRARAVSALSGGAFDPTVQPLWARYRDHFAGGGGGAPDLADLLPLVDWRALRAEPHLVAFDRPGMAATLNGIAQGYVTDRAAALLRRNGIDRVLLDLGETRALGRAPGGRPWRIGLADPADPSRALHRLELDDGAVATSGGYGTLFDPAGRHSHLIDPRSGTTAPAARGITVTAAEAATADAWSTAFALMTPDRIRIAARQVGGLTVHLAEGGRVLRLA